MINRTRFRRSIFDFSKLGGLVLCGALALGGCNKNDKAESAAASDTIKIGEYACLTGQTASFGTASHQGASMVIDDTNAAGGILERKSS